jgi:CHAD domain-containing protein
MTALAFADVHTIRREAATVRTLLEALEQLTGNEAEHVSQQLAEQLATLGRRLLDTAAAIARL